MGDFIRTHADTFPSDDDGTMEEARIPTKNLNSRIAQYSLAILIGPDKPWYWKPAGASVKIHKAPLEKIVFTSATSGHPKDVPLKANELMGYTEIVPVAEGGDGGSGDFTWDLHV